MHGRGNAGRKPRLGKGCVAPSPSQRPHTHAQSARTHVHTSKAVQCLTAACLAAVVAAAMSRQGTQRAHNIRRHGNGHVAKTAQEGGGPQDSDCALMQLPRAGRAGWCWGACWGARPGVLLAPNFLAQNVRPPEEITAVVARHVFAALLAFA